MKQKTCLNCGTVFLPDRRWLKLCGEECRKDHQRKTAKQSGALGIKHGHARGKRHTAEYRTWCGMRSRCNDPNLPCYPNYGGRGITVCERWNDFEAFFADMGSRPPGHSIERLDGNGNYTPENCRWATHQEQNENRRTVRWYEVDGARRTLAGWARHLGINKTTLRERIEKWPLRQALGADPRPRQRVGRPAIAHAKEAL